MPQTLLGVYDGHGGREAAAFCSEELATHVLGPTPAAATDKESRAALVRGIARAEQRLAAAGTASGSTALVVMLQRGGSCLNVAWVGDTKAVLCRGGRALPLTFDHRLTHPSERARVLAVKGATVEGGRLDGHLSLSRSLGCTSANSRRKPPGLSAIPDVRSEPLRPADEFVLLATDGLWDVLSPDEAVRIARAHFAAYEDPFMVAEQLVASALQEGADDNVTVMILRLFAPSAATAPAHCTRAQKVPRVGDMRTPIKTVTFCDTAF